VRVRFVFLTFVSASIVIGATIAVSQALADDPQPRGGWREPAEVTVLPRPAPEPPPPPVPRLDLATEVGVDIDGFLTWAALDRATGRTASSGNQVNTTESMVKAWIVADYLRRTAERGEEPGRARLQDASRAVRDSNNDATERLYAAGGHNAVIERMIDMCGLTDTEIFPFWWSRTGITAMDAVRLGECLADGTAAGPDWTDWVLTEMRNVRGSTAAKDQRGAEGFEGGRWGVIDGLPPEILDQGVAIKNGWTRIGDTDSWHLNCLAVADDWVLAVLMRYPAHYSLDYGAERCASVAAQLFTIPAPPPVEQAR
jgi:hypothetical protein